MEGEGDCSPFPGLIRGTVFDDANGDCNPDGNELQLADWILTIDGPDGLHYINADEQGHFRLAVPEGTYEIELLPKNPTWTICSLPQQIVVETGQVYELNLGATALWNCPYLEVDVGTPALEPCLDSRYFIQYANTGPATAIDAILEIELDEELFINI